MAKTDTVDLLYSNNRTHAVISVTENDPASNYKLSKIPHHQAHYINAYLRT